jgi:hypothetical protein
MDLLGRDRVGFGFLTEKRSELIATEECTVLGRGRCGRGGG